MFLTRPQRNIVKVRALVGKLDTFAGCQRGGLAMLFAIIVTALVAGAGVAVDYARMSTAETELQSVLDSATLAAVHTQTQTDAQEMLEYYVALHASKRLPAGEITATITSFDGVTLNATANATLPAALSSMMGIQSLSVSADSSAAKASYDELYFAVDLSGSMGVGATPADRDALEALTKDYVPAFYGNTLPQGCAFGCHRREGWEPDGKTVYQMARENGIRLREDELIAEFNNLADLLLDPTDEVVTNGLRKVSVIGFSENARELVAPTNDVELVKGALETFEFSERYQTSYAAAFSEFDQLLGTQGNGSQTDPFKTLVLITDGIESRDAFFSQSAIDTNLCDSIKNQGFRLAIIEIKYPKLYSNRLYDDTVLPVETTISPGLETCATSGWYFLATEQHEVPQKMLELKTKFVTAGVRLVK